MAWALVEALAQRGRIPVAEAAALLDSADDVLAVLQAYGVPASVAGGMLVWSSRLDLDMAVVAGELLQAGQACAIQHVVITESTNTRLLHAAVEGATAPRALFAEIQTAGRGRQGRSWQGYYGDTLMFSLLVDSGLPVRELPQLALASGVALARCLGRSGVHGVGLKWPNDLLLHGAKLAGVLVEAATPSRPGVAVIGVGLNWQLSAETCAAIGQPAAALAPALDETGLDRSAIAGRLLAALLSMVEELRTEGFESMLGSFADYDVLRDAEIDVATGSATRRGIALGLRKDGALRVRHDDDEVCYHSAEVSVRRA